MEERKRGRVLICDDSPFMRTQLSNILEKEHFETFETKNGMQAINNYLSIHPSVVFMDIVMPSMDGNEALEKILELDSNAKVIMCSSMRDPDIIESTLEHGALDYIVKPFKPERVIEAINNIL